MPIINVKREGLNVYAEVEGDVLIYVKPLTAAQADWLVNAVSEQGMINPKYWQPADLYWEAKAEAEYEASLAN